MPNGLVFPLTLLTPAPGPGDSGWVPAHDMSLSPTPVQGGGTGEPEGAGSRSRDRHATLPGYLQVLLGADRWLLPCLFPGAHCEPGGLGEAAVLKMGHQEDPRNSGAQEGPPGAGLAAPGMWFLIFAATLQNKYCPQLQLQNPHSGPQTKHFLLTILEAKAVFPLFPRSVHLHRFCFRDTNVFVTGCCSLRTL